MNDLETINRLGRELVAVGRLWRRLLSQQVSVLGLPDAQWSLLDNLNRSGDGISQKALAERLGLEPTAVVRVLKDMETSKLVVRDRHPKDTRNRLVRLTGEGRSLASKIAEIASECDREILRGFDEGALETFAGQLTAFRARIEALHRMKAKHSPQEA
jgi:Transcriptional regulators